VSFPQTRLTLIRRLVDHGDDGDWRQFLADYWRPICGFAIRRGNMSIQDAEDVASKTFEALLTNNLLARWQDNRGARLRTLLCSVTRNVIANQARVESGRKRIREELAIRARGSEGVVVSGDSEPTAIEADMFYAAWVDELLKNCVESLLHHLHRSGKGDYFRVLYGRLCEKLSTIEIADLLQIKTTDVENYYKAAKKMLADELEQAVRSHVQRYSDESSVADEFRVEWGTLSQYLTRHGGLEQAVRDGHLRTAEIPALAKSKSFRHVSGHFSRPDT
jgi:RNA polymerase sigma factor (sigma-70 family)